MKQAQQDLRKSKNEREGESPPFFLPLFLGIPAKGTEQRAMDQVCYRVSTVANIFFVFFLAQSPAGRLVGTIALERNGARCEYIYCIYICWHTCQGQSTRTTGGPLGALSMVNSAQLWAYLPRAQSRGICI